MAVHEAEGKWGHKIKENSSIYKETGFIVIMSGPLRRKCPITFTKEKKSKGSKAVAPIVFMDLLISSSIHSVNLSCMCSMCQA